jgi:hypothetical protein
VTGQQRHDGHRGAHDGRPLQDPPPRPPVDEHAGQRPDDGVGDDEQGARGRDPDRRALVVRRQEDQAVDQERLEDAVGALGDEAAAQQEAEVPGPKGGSSPPERPL